MESFDIYTTIINKNAKEKVMCLLGLSEDN